MANLKYRVNNDGALSDAVDHAPDAPSYDPVAPARPDQPQARDSDRAAPLPGEPDSVNADRLLKEIEAAVRSQDARTGMASGSGAVRDPGLFTAGEGPQQFDQAGTHAPASADTDSREEGRQWVLPSFLAVLAVSLGIFFLATYPDAGAPVLGGHEADAAVATPADSVLDSTTRDKLAQLNRQVVSWMRHYGDGLNPRELTLKRVREDLGLSSDQMLDSWGKPFRYEATDAGYTLRSAGADKTFDTKDDLQSRVSFPSRTPR